MAKTFRKIDVMFHVEHVVITEVYVLAIGVELWIIKKMVAARIRPSLVD
jgi:hypothetical protein